MQMRLIKSKRKVYALESYEHPPGSGKHYYRCFIPYNEVEQRNARNDKRAHEQNICASNLESIPA